MCGIVGIFTKNLLQIVNPVDLRRAVDAIEHRGPDESGMYIGESSQVGLGHTRLSIIDLSPTGSQPMFLEGESIAVVFNGEIYNFVELAEELKDAGVSFRGGSDTEVLLHLYRKYGKEMISHLNGIFTFAIWDSIQKTLFIARDAMGVKPLYYCEDEKGFAFSSEIKAICSLNQDLGSLDLNAVNQYLSFIWSPGERTLFSNVKKMSPGTALLVKNGSIVKQWNWYKLPAKKNICNDKRPKKNLIEETAFHLRNAVHSQLVADVEVGAFLSGGLDSSAIVAIAKEKIPNIRCFTISAAGGEGTVDDLAYAKKVATHLDVPLSVVDIRPDQMLADLETMIYHLDEPLADPSALNVMYISKLARESGIKVLLSGAGGDDLFTGYRRHYALMLERWWSWMPQRFRHGLSQTTSKINKNHPFGRRLAKMFAGAEKDNNSRLMNYFRWVASDELETLYTEDLKAVIKENKADKPISDFISDLPSDSSPLNTMLAIEQRFFLAEHNLLYTDKMSMAVGVEVRVPFLDTRLVDFATTIPDHLKQRGRCGKWILKKSMESYLPYDVIYRPKTGFGAPLRLWLKNELRDQLRSMLSTENLQRRGLFDPQATQSLIDRNEKGQVDASYTLFSMMCIELWCRHFIDQI